MSLRSFLASLSVRTILLTVLAVLGGWALEDSLEEVHDNYLAYRQGQDFSERVQLATHLLVAAQHLAYERGRIAVVLRGAPPISEANRRFVGERRSLADAALDKALAHLDGVPESVWGDVLKGRQALLHLRPRVDRDAGLPLAARDAGLAERWYDTAGTFILTIRAMVDRLTGEFPGGDATRLTLLAAATQELRITAGGEASRIAQALAAGAPPPAELRDYVHERRGREGLLWQQIEWMVGGANIPALRAAAAEVKQQHLGVFRPLQDRALAALAARRPATVPLDSLTSASLPTLDGISKLTILAAEHAMRVAHESALSAHAALVQHVVRAAFLVLLLALSFRYVVRHVTGPLARIDGDLRRMGALRSDAAPGNEIESLRASAAQLELSIAAQRRAERDLRSLGDNLPDNVARFDAEGRYRYVNPTHQRTLGMSAADLIGKCIGEVFPNSHLQVRMAIEQVLATGQAVLFVHQPVPDGNGGMRLHDVNLVPEFDDDGKVVGVLGIGRDMTDLYRMQEMLAGREREFRSLAENAPDYIARYDARCRIVYLNPRLEGLLGVSTAAVAGKTPVECLPADSFATYRAALERVIAEGEPVEFHLTLPEAGNQYHHVRMTPERGVDGAVSGVLAIGRDLTESRWTECRLEELRARLVSVMHTIPDALWLKDPDGDYLLCNHEFERLTGKSEAEIVGGTDFDLFDAEQAEFFRCKDREAIAAGCLCLNEEWVEHVGAARRVLLETRKAPIYGENGAVAGVLGVGRDVTERRLAEEALRTSEFRWKFALEGSDQGVWDWNLQSGKVEYSERYKRMLGYDDTEFAGRVESWAETLHPDDRAATMEAHRAHFDGETPAYGAEFRMRCKDGSWKWIHSRGMVIERDGEGKPLRMIGTHADISERKRWEEEQRHAAEFQNSLLQGIKDAGLQMMVIENGRVQYVADHENAALFGLTPADIAAGPDFLEVVHPDDRARVADNYRRRLAGEAAPSLYELGVVRADGTRRQHEVAVATIPGSEPLRVIAISRDVTERKLEEAAREAALSEAQRLARMRSAFLSQMSHELRTPLNGILGHVQLLLRADMLAQSQVEGLTIIQKSGDHLLALINDLLDHARIEADKLELNLADIVLGSFIDTVTGIVRVRAVEKHLEFVCDIAPGLPDVVRGDEQRLRQVLLNLLSNAIKFTDRGQVGLRVTPLPAGRLRFEVRDSGVGIPEEQREVIFEAFRQVGDASRRAAGTGLGLAISRQLVRMMGGDIAVESRVGEGSRFSFEIVAEVAVAPELHQPFFLQVAKTWAAGEGMRVPPQAELEALLALARRGNMRSIREHAAHLRSLDEEYRPFAARLEEMAKAFQSKALVEFVEACQNAEGQA